MFPISPRRVGRSHFVVLSEAFDLWLEGLCRKPHLLAGKAHGEGGGGFTAADGLGRKERTCWSQHVRLFSAGDGNVGLEIVVEGHESWGTGHAWCGSHPPAPWSIPPFPIPATCLTLSPPCISLKIVRVYMLRLDYLKTRPCRWWGSFSTGPILGRLQGAPLRRKLVGQDSALYSFPILAANSSATFVARKVNPHC